MRVYYVDRHTSPAGVTQGPRRDEECYFFYIDPDAPAPVKSFIQPIEEEL